MRSWQAELKVNMSWFAHHHRFATKPEAQAYALGMLLRWPDDDVDWRATPSDDPVTHAADDSGIVRPIGEFS